MTISPEASAFITAVAKGVLNATDRDTCLALLAAAQKHLEWIDKERAGPQYPDGVTRDYGGDSIWRAWWQEQLDLCRETEDLCRYAVAKVNDTTS